MGMSPPVNTLARCESSEMLASIGPTIAMWLSYFSREQRRLTPHGDSRQQQQQQRRDSLTVSSAMWLSVCSM